ncbi:hypothetical protein DFS34DRAFT_651795 [Phlyctochytrium arcticum]|nr:hypothetical protein DFS34DRAFT_651795 [Phlyctochytrium arcticum]
MPATHRRSSSSTVVASAAAAILLFAQSSEAIRIDRPNADSVVSPGQNVPIFATPLQTPTTTAFAFCAVTDAGRNDAVVAWCGNTRNGAFTVQDMLNGRVTADMPPRVPAGQYRVVIAQTIPAGCQAVSCAINPISGPNFAITAGPGPAAPQSDPATDPRGFGITLSLPARIAAGTATPVRILTDARFDEGTQITECNLVAGDAPTSGLSTPIGSCGGGAKAGAFSPAEMRAGTVTIGPPGNLRGAFRVELTVSSAGCRVDDNCFSDKVISTNFQVVAPGQADPAPTTPAPPAPPAPAPPAPQVPAPAPAPTRTPQPVPQPAPIPTIVVPRPSPTETDIFTLPTELPPSTLTPITNRSTSTPPSRPTATPAPQRPPSSSASTTTPPLLLSLLILPISLLGLW